MSRKPCEGLQAGGKACWPACPLKMTINYATRFYWQVGKPAAQPACAMCRMYDVGISLGQRLLDFGRQLLGRVLIFAIVRLG